MKSSLLTANLTVIAFCIPSLGVAQDQDEITYVIKLLNSAQAYSIDGNREMCGYIGYDASGQLSSTPPVIGKTDECAPYFSDDLDIIASWHTHAGYDVDAWSEVPSVNDIEADEEEGIDGYVATPGGRVWFVDTTDMMVSQICPRSCVLADKGFDPGAEGHIAQSYTYQQLLDREAAQ